MVGLSWTGWVWIFKNGADLGTGPFFLIWCIVWLYGLISFQVIDGACSLLEMRWMPFVVLSWIIAQVTSVISPHELANNFYRIDYFFPANHVWGVMMTIFGRGANNHLEINLPVLFVWYLVAASFGTFGNWTRWKKAHRAHAEAQLEKGKEKI